jgi:hypothetical protein
MLRIKHSLRLRETLDPQTVLALRQAAVQLLAGLKESEVPTNLSLPEVLHMLDLASRHEAEQLDVSLAPHHRPLTRGHHDVEELPTLTSENPTVGFAYRIPGFLKQAIARENGSGSETLGDPTTVTRVELATAPDGTKRIVAVVLEHSTTQNYKGRATRIVTHVTNWQLCCKTAHENRLMMLERFQKARSERTASQPRAAASEPVQRKPRTPKVINISDLL